MVIKVDFSKVKEIGWSQYAIRFALGGLITAVAGILAEKFGPAIGGLFLAFPAIFPASLTLVEKTERDDKRKKGLHGNERAHAAAGLDTYGATLGCVALMAFALLIWLSLPSHSPVIVLPAAAAIWIACALGMWAGLRWWRHRRGRSQKNGDTATPMMAGKASRKRPNAYDRGK
jgi:uncharacterized protein DUF3147